MHNILDEFEFRPDWTTDNELTAHERLKIPINVGSLRMLSESYDLFAINVPNSL